MLRSRIIINFPDGQKNSSDEAVPSVTNSLRAKSVTEQNYDRILRQSAKG
jgi:hypothetical protein